ncbi:MAG: hypothetical protein ABW292_05105 [Vicinamibacterales bacterium]
MSGHSTLVRLLAVVGFALLGGWASLLDGAGHWVQQEQPERVSTLLIQFLRDQAPSGTERG